MRLNFEPARRLVNVLQEPYNEAQQSAAATQTSPVSAPFDGFTDEFVEAVLPGNLYRVRGYDIPPTGTAGLIAGQRVTVAWVKSVPVVIVAHEARRAQYNPTPTPFAVGLEELVYSFVTVGQTTFNWDLWFRNGSQTTKLGVVSKALAASPTITGPTKTSGAQAPIFFRWGARDDTFMVGFTAPQPNLLGGGNITAPVFVVFRLNRSVGQSQGATPAIATVVKVLPCPNFILSTTDYPGGFNGIPEFQQFAAQATGDRYLTKNLDVIIIGTGEKNVDPAVFPSRYLERTSLAVSAKTRQIVWKSRRPYDSYTQPSALFSSDISDSAIIMEWDDVITTNQRIAIYDTVNFDTFPLPTGDQTRATLAAVTAAGKVDVILPDTVLNSAPFNTATSHPFTTVNLISVGAKHILWGTSTEDLSLNRTDVGSLYSVTSKSNTQVLAQPSYTGLGANSIEHLRLTAFRILSAAVLYIVDEDSASAHAAETASGVQGIWPIRAGAVNERDRVTTLGSPISIGALRTTQKFSKQKVYVSGQLPTPFDPAVTSFFATGERYHLTGQSPVSV